MRRGSIPIDKALCRKLAEQTFSQMNNPEGFQNHFKATAASYDLYTAALSKITAPTHIIQGGDDPIFSLPHGLAIQKAIQGSTLFVMPGLGHSFMNENFFHPTIENIVTCAKEADKRASLSCSSLLSSPVSFRGKRSQLEAPDLTFQKEYEESSFKK